jgi:hypothetical protein
MLSVGRRIGWWRIAATGGAFLFACGVYAGCGHAGQTGQPTNDVASDAGAGPNVQELADALFTPTQATNLCVAFQACFPKQFPYVWASLNDCVNGLDLTSLFFPQPGDFTAPQLFREGIDGPAVDFYECALDAGPDCTKVAACLRLDPSPDTCIDGGAGLASGSCTGSLLHGCTYDSDPFAVDCARYGTVCEGGTQACQFQFTTCPEGVASPCEGPQVVGCTSSGQVIEVFSCALEGPDSSCAETGDGGAACVGTVPCSADAGATCEGTVAVGCSENGWQTHLDCASRPNKKRCVNGACAPTGTECDPSQPSTCQGNSVVYCDDGFSNTADCTPFGTCVSGACVHM